MIRFCRISRSVCILLVLLSLRPAVASDERGGGRRSRDAALFSEAEYLKHVTFLASDELEGRGTGQPGIDKAAEYVAGVFKQLGVEPAGDGNSYFQTFELKLRNRVTAGTRLAVGTGGRLNRRPVALDEEYRPFPFSGRGSFRGEVVFAGYGIVSEEHEYDDYAGIDVTDKVVLVLRRGPKFAEFGIQETSFRAKASRASTRNAAAMLVVNPVGDEEGDRLYDFETGATPGMSLAGANYGLPMVHIRRALADRLLEAGGLPDVESLQQKIEQARKPCSAELDGVSVRGHVDVEAVPTPVRNVVGRIPGTGPQKDEIIVLGAHYDHLGIRRRGQERFNPARDISNGADDNASGTSLIMTLARAFTQGPRPNRTLLLILFTGEEMGLLGSKHWVDHPTVDLDNVVAMLNFDMVGRLKDDRLEVGGMRTGGFEEMIRRLAEPYGFVIRDGGGGVGPSDHTSFYRKKIPVLFFFTGLHRQYHQPEDDTPLLNIPGAIRIARFVADVIDAIDAHETPPAFQADTRRARIARQGDRDQPDSDRDEPAEQAARRDRVRMGIMPDPENDQPGVFVAGVMEESPAERAGMKEGDRIVKIGKMKIENLSDLVAAMQGFKSGDRTSVVVRRDGKDVTLDVQFGEPALARTDDQEPRPSGRAAPRRPGPPQRARDADRGEEQEDGEPAPPPVRLGVGTAPSTDPAGLLVAQVMMDSPAARAGIIRGDVIVELAGRPVRTREDVAGVLRNLRPGDRADVVVERDGERTKLNVRFVEADSEKIHRERLKAMADAFEAFGRKVREDAEENNDADKDGAFVLRRDEDYLELRIRIFDLEDVPALRKAISEILEHHGNRGQPRFAAEWAIPTLVPVDGSTEMVVRIERAVGERGRAERESSPPPGLRAPPEPPKPRPPAHPDEPDEEEMAVAMPAVRLGIMPTYGEADEEKEGYEISGVVPDGPAARAGMTDSDRIYSIGGVRIRDVYGYMDALRKYKPGDEIEVVVIRDGRKVTLTIKATRQQAKEAA